MRILVYGTGVLGSYLAHVLIRGGNEVTVLARGQRLKELKEHGLVIRHYIQRRTTVDPVDVIDILKPEDIYDLIFVVMQYTHLHAVLPVLAENQSSKIIFVGNNADGGSIQKYILSNSPVYKEVAFGFQSTGGRIEGSQVICVRMGGHMELGGLDSDLSWRSSIDEAFTNTKYKLTYYNNMDAWHKSHIAMIMPLCYATYACEGDLHRVSGDKKLLNQIMDAMDEGYKVLETLDYRILPPNEADFVRKKRRLFYLMLKIVTATSIGRLAISDHATSAVEEMTALHNAFHDLKQLANTPTPNWDALECHCL